MLDPADGYFAAGRNAFLAGDLRTARRQYKAALKAGSVAAIHNLGVMLLHGQGCAVNYELARSYFEESALHGIPESMNQLGYMYYYGKGCLTDYALARGWFLSSDMHGSHFYAQYHLGMMYALGQGASQDWREAAKWLQMSSDQGYVPAIYNLGVLYFNGDGVRQSYDKALALYAKAARMGHPEGENNYAVMCAEGLGTHKHKFDEVMHYWESAAAKNVSSAHVNLVNIHLDEERLIELKEEEPEAGAPHKALPSKLPSVPNQSMTLQQCTSQETLKPSKPKGRANKPLPLPTLPMRKSSRNVQIIAPPSPFFHEFSELARGLSENVQNQLTQALSKPAPSGHGAPPKMPRSPTEPELDKPVNMTRSFSATEMRKPPAMPPMPAEPSPVVTLRSYDTIASRRKVLVADLCRMPPTPV